MEKNKKEINQTSKSLALQLLRFVFTDKKCFHPLKKKWFPSSGVYFIGVIVSRVYYLQTGPETSGKYYHQSCP